MGRPKLNKEKLEANKEYLKRYCKKNEEKYKTIPCPNIVVVSGESNVGWNEINLCFVPPQI